MKNDKTTIGVNGIGWIEGGRGKSVLRNRSYDFEHLKELYQSLRRDRVVSEDIENFERFDTDIRRVVCGIALTVDDTGESADGDCALLGTDPAGPLEANLKYFRDYVDAGRKMGRANLFIYTLSSSPLAEGAIAFGLTGPLYYFRTSENPLKNLLKEGKKLINNGEASQAILVNDFHKRNITFSLKQVKKSRETVELTELETLLSDLDIPLPETEDLGKL